MIEKYKRKFSTKYFIFIIILLGFSYNILFGQSSSTSPYSRFGIGDLQSNSFVQNLGMGYSGLAVHEPFSINFTNPASYASLRLTNFEFGATSNFTWYESTGFPAFKTNSSNISYVAIGFPVISGKWGASFGILPFSNVGYEISNNSTLVDGNNADFLYTGNGGINQFYFGNGINICRNLSIGLNASYLFGSINRVNSIAFPGLIGYYDTRLTNSTRVADTYFTFGISYSIDSILMDSLKYIGMKKITIITSNSNKIVLCKNKDSITIEKPNFTVLSNNYERLIFTNYTDTFIVNNVNGKLVVDSLKNMARAIKIKSDKSFTFAMTASLSTKINTHNDSLVERYINNNGLIIVHDTTLNNTGIPGNITLPLSIGGGISYRNGYKWLINADVSMQDWSKFSGANGNEQLANSLRISAGTQYTPGFLQTKSYFKKITYRFGGYFYKTFLDLKATQLNDFGISFGMGLPVYRSISTINLAIQLGQRGTLQNNLIREQYLHLTLGFSLSDKWFNKYKYD